MFDTAESKASFPLCPSGGAAGYCRASGAIVPVASKSEGASTSDVSVRFSRGFSEPVIPAGPGSSSRLITLWLRLVGKPGADHGNAPPGWHRSIDWKHSSDVHSSVKRSSSPFSPPTCIRGGVS
jgi:hypothetical protein